MSLVPVGEPRTIGGFTVQYVGDKSHRHEGGHSIAADGRTVLVLPDDRTNARKRSHAISRLLHAITEGEADPVATLVGGLVLEGITSIHVDGTHILADQPHEVLASFRFDIVETPTGPRFEVVSIGAA